MDTKNILVGLGWILLLSFCWLSFCDAKPEEKKAAPQLTRQEQCEWDLLPEREKIARCLREKGATFSNYGACGAKDFVDRYEGLSIDDVIDYCAKQ